MTVARVWGKGQLTTPISLRKELNIKEDSPVNLAKAGDAILRVPYPRRGR